jgi:hypothetical protein
LNFLGQSLRDDLPVKRIAVMRRQAEQMKRVLRRVGQYTMPKLLTACWTIPAERLNLPSVLLIAISTKEIALNSSAV